MPRSSATPPPVDSVAGAEYLPLSARQFLQQCLGFLGAAGCVTLLTISDESHSLGRFFYLSHKIICSEDVRDRRCTVHSLLLGKAIIHGYTKEDTYGSHDQAARFI